MDIQAFVREMLKVDSSMRYVSIVKGSEYRVLASVVRENVTPHTSEEINRNFNSIIPK